MDKISKSNGVKLQEQVYCSLDIETSGFDPLKDEILEVGFVKFQISNFKFQILEEWTRVFKPTKPVEAKILGLTGIKQDELDSAPNFSDFKDEVQNKLKDTIIVGHNVIFDIKFLESRGIKFSGNTIDTLDLAQWLLPTHHSYNLENLMHFFGIKHENAHRALADAQAALEVLKALLGRFSVLSKNFQIQILELLNKSDFLWKELLKSGVAGKVAAKKNNPRKTAEAKSEKLINLLPNSIYNFPLQVNFLEETLAILNNQPGENLLVLPNSHQVMNLWREGLVKGVFSEQTLFDEKKFLAFLKKAQTPDEIKFALKILVWQESNWQNETILDLNLSFFGGQFRQQICGKKNIFPKNKILACDMSTFLELAPKDIKNRIVVVAGLAEFEAAISNNLSEKVSWSYIVYNLESLYNARLNIGQKKFKEPVEQMLIATDLFFGLVSALLQTDPPGFVDTAITSEFKQSEKYNKIEKAATSYCLKITEVNKILELESLEKTVENLKNFFIEQENRVKWIELSQKRCVFNNSPLLINNVAAKVFANFPNILFIDQLAPESATRYFVDRLGLINWQQVFVKREFLIKKQKDLFDRPKIECVIEAQNPAHQTLLNLIGPTNLPAAVLFGLPKSMKEFYEQSYSHLKTYATLLAQSGSGGSNKLFHNFAINQNGLLLATDRLVLKSLANVSGNVKPKALSVKTLIILRLPFDPVSHPYSQALALTYPNAFEAMALPKALYNFHQLVSFFNTPKLERVYLFDAKLNKAYANAFREYLDILKN